MCVCQKACCLLSSIILISVSNYCQYIGPYIESLGFDISYLGIITASASLGEYFGAKIVKKIKTTHRHKTLLFFAVGIAAFVLAVGRIDSIAGAAVGYFGINTIYAAFTILLSEEFQSVIDSKHRATMLSVSNQVDELFSVITDPIIGKAIDHAGFGMTYQFLGGGTLALVMLASVILVYVHKKLKIKN